MLRPPLIEPWSVHSRFLPFIDTHASQASSIHDSHQTLLRLSRPLQITHSTTDADTGAIVTQIDFKEQASGYQAAYSKLSASESAPFDPVGYVADPRAYLVDGLNKLNREVSGFRGVLARCDAGVCGPFLTEGRKFGLEF